MRTHGGKHAALNTLLVLLSVAVGVAALEAGGQAFAILAKKGKVFRPDVELGWTPLPHLDLVRKNADGELWRITTDDRGIRGPSAWGDDDRTRLLILGDSFAFGEGIDLADRFDTLIEDRMPDLSIVNLGVMGYGPDQQLIRARPWKTQLRRGDAVLLLTYHGNDFHDLARTRHGGRSKPWLEDVDHRLVEHKPAIDAFDILRDRSYAFTLLTRSLARLGQSEHTEQRLENVGDLYRNWVVQEVADLVARGVLVVIVHHGASVHDLPFDTAEVLAKTCPHVSGCLALDETLDGYPRDEVFLKDGHWARGGHRIAAERIAAYLRSLPGFGESERPTERTAPVVGQGENASGGAL